MWKQLEHRKSSDADEGTGSKGKQYDFSDAIILTGTVVETCDRLHSLGNTDSEGEEDKADFVDDACTGQWDGFSIDGLGTIES